MSSVATPPAEVAIEPDLVRALLAEQHPDLADAPLGDRVEGWDNVTYRLGNDLAVRMPRRAVGASLTSKELEWLPRLCAGWSFHAPVPVRHGRPGHGYPWWWSVVPWLDGTTLYDAPLDSKGARDLGRALAQVHQPAPANAPINPFRSGELATRAERLDLRLNAIDTENPGVLDGERAREIFASGAMQARGVITWTHLDLHGANILTRDGRLAAILDWGDLAAGDPATDLGQTLAMVGRRAFKDVLKGYSETRGPGTVRSGLSEQTARRVEAEAVVAAALFASLDEPEYRLAGWRALVDLQIAARVPDAAAA